MRDPFDREGWLFELKWDDFRTIAETDGTDGVKLYSRNQSDFKKRFPPIADALANPTGNVALVAYLEQDGGTCNGLLAILNAKRDLVLGLVVTFSSQFVNTWKP